MTETFHLYLAFGVGTIAGMLILAFLLGSRTNVRSERESDVSEDTDLLDFLQDAKCHLFFNESVGDHGSWGFLGSENDLMAVGLTPRQAIGNARLKAAAQTANEVSA